MRTSIQLATGVSLSSGRVLRAVGYRGSRIPQCRLESIGRVTRGVLAALALGPGALAGHPAWGQSASAESSATDAGALQEITVTATRSSQSLDKVPVSVTALTSDAIESKGIRDMDDITRLVPGVSFGHGLGSTSSISIRGIASSSGAATTGIYINDTPIQSRDIGQAGTNSNAYPTIFDLERVEVLRGPQGTLFGAGSQGGTIRFITPQPDLARSSTFVRSELAYTTGGEPTYETGVAVGTPLVQDRLAVRFSGDFRHEGGFIDRVDPYTGHMVNKNNDWSSNASARLALLYAPTDNIKITPAILYQRTNINDKSAVWGYLSNLSSDQFRTGAQINEPTQDLMVLPTLDVSIDMGAFSLFSNTSYFRRSYQVTQNFSNFIPGVVGYDLLPGVFIPNLPGWTSEATDWNSQGNFSQEIRLQSNDRDARFKWTAGIFYQRAVQDTSEYLPETEADYNAFSQALFGVDAAFGPLGASPTNRFAPGTLFSFLNLTQGVDKQIALFGDLTFRVTDELSLNAGLRVAQTEFDFSTSNDGPFAGGLSHQTGEQKEHPVTPKVNISYQATPDNLFYASASKGFRGGGVNNPLSTLCSPQLASLGYEAAPKSYNSDNVWSYEIGSKNAFLDRRIRLEASAYWINWSQIQQSIYLSGCGENFTANIGKANSKGFDLSIEARPVDPLTAYASVGYTKAEYTQTITGGAGGAIIVNKGNTLPATPVIATAGAEYTFTAFDRKSYTRLDYTYKSASRTSQPEFDPSTISYNPRAWQAPASQMVNGRLGTHFGGLDLSVFIDNLLDSHTYLARINLAPSHNQVDEFVIQRPRTFGVTALYRY